MGRGSTFLQTSLALLFYMVLSNHVSTGMCKTYFITPGLRSLCPDTAERNVRCLSLSQYATESKDVFALNTTLILLPGKHDLDSDLTFANMTSLVVTSAKANHTAVYCYKGTSISVADIQDLLISGIEIVGCERTLIRYVNYFKLVDAHIRVVHDSIWPGIFLQNASCEIVETQFSSSIGINEGIAGGAIYVVNSNISLSNSVFVGNSGRDGAAIFLHYSNATIKLCHFINNSAVNCGGAILAAESTLEISSGLFQGNTALNVSTLCFHDCNVTIYNNTFTNNVAGVSGLYFGHCMVVLNMSHIVNNSNTAIYVQGPLSRLFISNCVLSGNTCYQHCITTVGCDRFGNVTIVNSTIQGNTALKGGAVYSWECTVKIENSTLNNNTAYFGGAIYAVYSVLILENSSLSGNVAASNRSFGGGVFVWNSTVDIVSTSLEYNTARESGGAMSATYSTVGVKTSILCNNKIDDKGDGGAVSTFYSSLSITDCLVDGNSAPFMGGGISIVLGVVVVIQRCTFTNNEVTDMEGNGGAVSIYNVDANIDHSSFLSNKARFGGAVSILFAKPDQIIEHSRKQILLSFNEHTLTIRNGTFKSNTAIDSGGAIFIRQWDKILNLVNVTFTNNKALQGLGGALYSYDSNVKCSGFLDVQNNAGYLGAVNIAQTNMTIDGTVVFFNNSGSFFALSSKLELFGESCFLNNSYYSHPSTFQEGGAITLFQSQIFLIGNACFTYNQADVGGAILAIESTMEIPGNATIQYNRARSSGGGIYAYQSQLTFKGDSTITDNFAVMDGGGMYMVNTIVKLLNGSLSFVTNGAEKRGGGVYIEQNSKLYIVKDHNECSYEAICNNNNMTWLVLEFRNNTADHGGGIYVDDYTISDSCRESSQIMSTECFCQVLVTYSKSSFARLKIHVDLENGSLSYIPAYEPDQSNFVNIYFKDNTARITGDGLYGGLIDRCTISPFAEILVDTNITTSAVSYLLNVTDIDLDAISSDPVRVCFCTEGQPDCEYQPPTLYVKKGHPLKVSAITVDQVNTSIPGTIHSLLNGGLSDGQLVQETAENCTDLTYNIVSPRNSESLKLYAEGPCKDIGISQRVLSVKFLPCACPIGFELSESENNCKCVCDSELLACISDCSSESETLLRESDCWFDFVNTSNHSGYVIHKHCPFDYCFPHTQPVKVNLNVPDGADAQCAFNRSGKLCGSCADGLSLSVGSSHCVLCSNQWLLLLVPFALIGVVLVVVILVCRLTVDVGTLSGLIFYANIVTANHAVFLPFEKPNFVTVFIAWLNLDFGFETCLYDGLDAYVYTWLQFAFPAYIVSLVAMIVVLCEHSERFNRLFYGKRPIAVLATLIFLSYTKLFRTIIAVLSFTTLEYPDGTHEVVWLFDANVTFLRGKHIPLFIAAVLVFLLGLVFTVFLFFWQWLTLCPRRRGLTGWMHNGRFHDIMDAFLDTHTYKAKTRYWTGMLLLGRVILYTVSSLNVFGDPRVNLYSVFIMTLAILLLKLFTRTVYRVWPIDFLESSFIILLNTFAVSTWYVRETGGNQEVLAYFINAVVFIMALGILIFHMCTKLFSIEPSKSFQHLKKLLQRRPTVREPINDRITLVDHSPTETEWDLRDFPPTQDTTTETSDEDQEEEEDDQTPLLPQTKAGTI